MSNVGGWVLLFSVLLCENDEKFKVMEFFYVVDIYIDDVLIEKKIFDFDDLLFDMLEVFRDVVIG